MNLTQVLSMVDEFGLAMRDDAKHPGSISPATLNQQRERLHDAIRRIASNDQAEEAAATVAERTITAASVDRTRTTLTDGSPVTPDHRNLRADGQQKAYVVLSAEERAKGFVRPVRNSYVHEKCGVVTTMGGALAETYARDPQFYGATFCAGCRAHFPVGEGGEFTWRGTNEKVGHMTRDTNARGIVTREGQDPQGLGGEAIEPGPAGTRPEATRAEVEKLREALPPLPKFYTDESPWKEFLAWERACRGNDAGKAADVVDAALAKLMQDYARAALSATQPKEGA